MIATTRALDHPQQTVLITGASAGLGEEFARRLAHRGSDLVLVARRAERLEALAAELRDAHGVTVTTLPADLTRAGVGQDLKRELQARGVTVTSVVNNAGFASQGLFHDEELMHLRSEIALDVSAVVEISHTFMPALRERGEGFLINVASTAAYVASPSMAVYAASTAFVLSFTEALWYEARGTGLRVLALCPGPTQTEFFDVAGDVDGGSTRRMPPAEVVATAFTALERRNPPPSVIAGRSNRLTAMMPRLLGRRRTTGIVGSMALRNITAGR